MKVQFFPSLGCGVEADSPDGHNPREGELKFLATKKKRCGGHSVKLGVEKQWAGAGWMEPPVPQCSGRSPHLRGKALRGTGVVTAAKSLPSNGPHRA